MSLGPTIAPTAAAPPAGSNHAAGRKWPCQEKPNDPNQRLRPKSGTAAERTAFRRPNNIVAATHGLGAVGGKHESPYAPSPIAVVKRRQNARS